jgi:hypothetical protein
MTKHEAIYQLNPSVVTIRGDVAYDADGNEVSYDSDAADALVESNAYKDSRAAEYPAIGDQLDALWKGGEAAQAMLEQVMAVKARHPKPE